MIKVSLRSLLLGTAVSVGLVASAGTANAIQYNFGDVVVNLDTTVSTGVSARTVDRDNMLVSSASGGPNAGPATSGPVTFLPGAFATTGANALAGGGSDTVIYAPTVVSGSINSDDSRLNFERGDLTSAIAKMTNDISASFQNYKFFARVSSYYDAVLSRGSSYNRSELVDGKADAARDIRLLDFYGSADYNIGDLPLNLRAGKQVISWGESTFMLNGINSINPIDVNAFRRPGAEVKEGLVPVWALDASIGLPHNLSLEAFYQLKWEPFQLDRAGTPFASSDVAATGSDVYGNFNGVSYLTTGFTGGLQRNCGTTSANNISAAFTADYLTGTSNTAALKDCSAAPGSLASYVDYTNQVPEGMMEFLKNTLGDTGGMVSRLNDRRASNSGQWGLAGRWYSEDLNNTEFGLYFMNYHSRLPIASERITSHGSADSQFTSYLANGDKGSLTGRATYYTGCNIPGAAAALPGGTPAQWQAASPTLAPGQGYGIPVSQNANSISQLNSSTASDPDGVYATAKTIAQAYYDGDAATLATFGLTSVPRPANAANPFQTGAGGINGVVAGGAIASANGIASFGTVAANSLLETTIINCALVALQSTATATGIGLLQNGAEIISVQSASSSPLLGLYLEYPEDIHMIGASFNTTIGTWGVQGEMSYRSNQPFQLDTDQITIAALNDACILSLVAGPTIANGVNDTYGGGCGTVNSSGAAGSFDLSGVVRSKMYTFDVGTTATYSNSNQLVAGTGADLGILVTEVGLVYAPDVPSEGDFSKQQWGNVCTGGTDLPFGGALGLAARSGCRPTAASWGYTILGQLQYNNAFGTAVTLSPTIAFSHDVSGNTPGPISNYRQGRKSVNLALNGAYQGAWRAGVSYTNFFGSDKYSESVDKDYASVNLSYAF
ncbi:MAG TPA: DUF1302 domain-containing protein [Parvibaculum sp.]